jgi:hypothetical protein
MARVGTVGPSSELSTPHLVLFATICGVGGARGWYVAKPLWAMPGWLAKLIGGVGMCRVRRHPDHLRVGDAWLQWDLGLYWWLLLPAHAVIWHSSARRLVADAEARARRER